MGVTSKRELLWVLPVVVVVLGGATAAAAYATAFTAVTFAVVGGCVNRKTSVGRVLSLRSDFYLLALGRLFAVSPDRVEDLA